MHEYRFRSFIRGQFVDGLSCQVEPLAGNYPISRNALDLQDKSKTVERIRLYRFYHQAADNSLFKCPEGSPGSQTIRGKPSGHLNGHFGVQATYLRLPEYPGVSKLRGQPPGELPAHGTASRRHSCCQQYGKIQSSSDRRHAHRKCRLPGLAG